MNKSVVDRIAGIIRIITIPPIMVAALLILVRSEDAAVFSVPESFFVSLLCLAVLPVLAYAVWAIVPSLRKKGRDSQRKLAFLFTFAGYLAALLYGLLRPVTDSLQLIYNSYYISSAVLFFLNFVCKIKASGHICSIAGPLILCLYFIGPWSVLPCILIMAASFWASYHTGRHSVNQMLLGMAVPAAAFGAAYVLYLI